MIKFDDGYYYLDIDAVTDYVFDKNEILNITECEKTLDCDNNLINTIQKYIPENEKYAQIKYDIIKDMVNVLYNSGVENVDGNVVYMDSMVDNGLGPKLIFNSLLVKNLIKNKISD